MDFVPLLVLSTTVKKVVDLVKYLTNTDWNAVVTQLVTWATGIATTWVAAQTNVASSFHVGDYTLASLNGWGQVLVGVLLSSTAATGWDTIKALDNFNSAVVPNLIPGTGPVQVPVSGAATPTAPVSTTGDTVP